MISERIKNIEKLCAQRGTEQKPSHFMQDYHSSALTRFASLPLWEKLARSMAYAVENQDAWVYEDDRIGGRIYYNKEIPVTEHCPDLDYNRDAKEEFARECPEVAELDYLNFSGGPTLGHISWHFEKVLRMGTEGMKAECIEALKNAKDEKAEEFYRGVIIMIDALQAFNDKHIELYEQIGNHELAERMRRVPRYPAESFEDAVQSFFMQHIVVMRENPFGGNSPGRLDYHLWPYLERDINKGIYTLEQAKELNDELFLRIDERLHCMDAWGETLSLGGTHQSGASAVNPLTYIMIETMIDLNITHPYTYIRVPKDPSKDLINLCTRYIVKGTNRAQLLSDEAIIKAQMANGVPFKDAVEYACGGCMEVSVQGKTSDYLYTGCQNIPKMLELMVTGGYCLREKKQYDWFGHKGSLASYSDFESFYSDFIDEVSRYVKLTIHRHDIYSEHSEIRRPSYLISSMIDDCMARGRNMHAGGAVYHDYGYSAVGMPNAADGLYAIKVAVFDKKICSAEELIEAMKNNYEGYEKLQARLRAIAKYGMDDADADALANRLMNDIADLYLTTKNRWGGKGKPIILTFTYSSWISAKIGATPDGRKLGGHIAHGVTPYSSSMTEGITAAINSCCKMPFDKFAGGASTMWDLDCSWVNEDLVEALITTFIQNGGHMFQGNTTDVAELIAAREHPEDYSHLVVRVGGYSARFVTLSAALQDDIINRIRHKS